MVSVTAPSEVAHPVMVPYLPMMSVLMSTDPLASLDSAASLVTSDTSLTRRPLLDGLGQTDGVPLHDFTEGVLLCGERTDDDDGLAGLLLRDPLVDDGDDAERPRLVSLPDLDGFAVVCAREFVTLDDLDL